MPSSSPLFDRFAPLFFVLIWSTGWIVARYSAEYADPLTFLCFRFGSAGLLLLGLAVVARAPFPKTGRDWGHALISGAFLHALYLGGVWWAIRAGLPASVSALIAAVQPIATALLAPALLGERGSWRRSLGVVLGLVGLVLVLWPKLSAANIGAGALTIIGVNILAMLGATAGFFYQKRFLPAGDLRAMAGVQYVGAFVLVLPAAYLLEPMHIEWNWTMALVLAWSVLALSIGAIWLLLLLIRHGEVSRASALIYLVPPTAAAQAWLLFGETLNALQIAGMALTAVGVAIAARRQS
ncbi:DMT family transporter [Methylocapsa sp. S129]|uniref:DMT family transporter n=1 Tax=Methylocapsa sp. S129 TaxID=1641869 RepID=UPI00131B5D40|nr:DMT family transporter [Methylocapsa sp. S129]